ncbi:YlmC/YmxH family sporulation protein [Scatolibacter rhodanostii]|uniref:YlmC/YmxH family sporulation protein n=1 Tax=Scatolibacter rhodanostii TaxID=2014781 RepID=UPI001FA842D6|nr:YlmC/YmxH family sporulation protein [Scatolibacter rhodanostii]
MNCRMGELRNKEVVNVKDGIKIGYISDIEIDTKTARLSAIIIYGRLRWLGLLGREDDVVIPWSQITLIGSDAVLVEYEEPREYKKHSVISEFLDKISF